MFFKQNIESYFDVFSKADYNSLFADSIKYLEELKSDNKSGKLPLFSPDTQSCDIDQIIEVANEIKSHFQHLIILGTGGSSLCGQTLTGFNEFERRISKSSPEITYMDNVDPNTFEAFFQSIKADDCCFLVISKSGGTLETMSQFSLCHSFMSEKLGSEKAAKHFYIITDPIKNPLRDAGNELSIKILDHKKDIGGRFSILTNVGLLPAAVAGLDIRKICFGASQIVKSNFDNPQNSESLQGAVLSYLAMENDKNINVYMPYIDSLKNLSSWFRQIWSESLGKDNRGSTPINGIGTLDQHSQLQLYLDGPDDKIYTFVILKNERVTQKINSDFLEGSILSYANGKTLSDVIFGSYHGTKEALVAHNRAVRTFELDSLDETILGALVMNLIFETVLTGKIMNIDPFDQPAVEESKIISKKLLSEMV